MDYVSAVSSAIMALVWVVYFQLFFMQYRRGNRAYLVIHHAQNESPDAPCLLVNMGQEPVHLQCVQAVTRSADGKDNVFTVTKYDRVAADDTNIQENLRQGPIQPGGYLVLGSFRDIILGRRSEEDCAGQLIENVSELELRAAVIHGPSKFPIGARRRFYLQHNGKSEIFPENIHTEQLVGRRDKKEVSAWIEDELNPKKVGRSESEDEEQTD
ncbi:hypothetical protein [Marinobacter sp.]|uniref:hypothetical protein n=1 Tax=Marinobacter sp. TaxID=50741 RepID=UPI0034A4F897